MKDIGYLKKYYKGNIEEAKERLKQGEPVQYIIGNVDFYGNIINVNKNVLIPRFETEELMSRTIDYIKFNYNNKLDIADIGTGSGCIAITLKKELNCNVDAVDISSKAIELAKENALANNVDIDFYIGNLLEPLNKKYDIIISNPPYISYDEEIMDIVKNNEPEIALYAPNDGTYYYKEILKNSRKYLKGEFSIIFEIGSKQGDKLISLAKKYYPEARIKIDQDLQGNDRYCFIEGEL